MDEILPLPTICVDLDSLYDGSCDRRIIPGYEETNHSADELSLVVRLDKEICPVLSADSPSGTLPRPLDLQQVDFLGSIDVVKKLFSMPYTDQRPLFTLHRMGNTLLLDNVTCHDTNPYDINFSADDKSHKYRENNDGRSANPSAVTVAGGRMQPLQYADFTFNSLDHLITSTNIESLLGKVTPLYLPAPSKPQSEPYRGLLMNEEVCERQTSAYSRQDRQDACRLNGIQESYSPLRVDNTTISENPAVSPKKNDLSAEGTQAELGSTKEGGASSHSKTPVTDEYKRGVSIASGSPFLPPPNYFMPSAPPPARQVLSWDLHEMRLALSSDLTIYRTDQHPAFTVKSLDTTQEFELSTCLDFYLENVMANVPEFALALHTKGFIRGIKLVRTSDIPFLNPAELSDPPTRQSNDHDSRNTGFKQREGICGAQELSSEFSVKQGSVSVTVPATRNVECRGGHEMSNRSTSSSSGISWAAGERLQEEQQQPMFDPKIIDMDASTILRFLQANCRREDGTYILRQSTDGDALHLYDLGLASSSKQKHFKWMLAMISYRFAIRLGHHVKIATPRCRTQIRQRQMHLFSSCYQLLRDIKEMGGEDHGTIRAAVLEQMADVHLSRVDDFSFQEKNNLQAQDSSNSVNDKRKEGTEQARVQVDDEEDFHQHEELQDAVQLLCRSVECLGALINKEIASVATSRAQHGGSNSRRERTDGAHIGSRLGQHSDDSVGTQLSEIGEGSSKLIFSPEEEVEGNDDANGDHEGISGRGGIVETLAVQLAGVLHKLVQASLVMVMNCIRTAKIAECLDCLCRLVAPCDLWSQLRLSILSTIPRATEQRMEEDRRNCEGLWGADMTIVQTLPILWDLTGETCREIAKQTAGISLEDTDIKQQLETLVLSWGRLSKSVLINGNGAFGVSSNLTSNPMVSVIENTFSLLNCPLSNAPVLEEGAAVSTSSKRAKARLRAKLRAKENVQTPLQTVKDHLDLLTNTASSHNWQMLASFLPSLPDLTDIDSSPVSDQSLRDATRTTDQSDIVRALRDIHSIVAPLVLHDSKHLDYLEQLSSAVRENANQTDPNLYLAAHIAFTTQIVHAVGIDKACQNELQVSLLMTYCFLSAALLHHLKAVGGIKYHTGESRSVNNSTVRKSSAMKTKSQRSQRAGGTVGPLGLKVSDPNVRLCLRRLGDSCNSISQRLVAYSAASISEGNEGDRIGSLVTDATNLSNRKIPGNLSRRRECDALSYQLFSASLIVFESVGDISNAAMVRCNLSSLLRSKATWEMSQYKGCSTEKEKECFQTCFERSLKHLKEAQRHCDYAVLSFNGSDSECNDKSKISIPKGNIRDNVAMETAQTCLNIGVLKKSEIFRSHVYGTGGTELQALLFAEKEKAVVGALETALELFYELRNDRQAAAVHYQLGSFYSSYWPLYPSRSDGLLEKALLHYREAHSYYSKYDVGPTLLLILIDMCDLYLSAYSATEPFLKSAKNVTSSGESVGQTISEPMIYEDLQHGAPVSTSLILEAVDLNCVKSSDKDVSAPSSVESPGSYSESELVIALLGGALQSLLESRFAFTPVVAERSRYRSQILSLAADVAKRLGGVLIKVLKAHSRGFLPSLDPESGIQNSSSITLGEVKARPFEELCFVDPTATPVPTFEVDESHGVTTVPSYTTGRNDMVLEARKICTELLRWSAIAAATPATTEGESRSASASFPLPGAVGTVSVNRLYELINMVNQNPWLRRCATNSQ